MKALKVTAKAAKNYYYEKDPIFNANGEGKNIEYGGKLAEVLGLREGQKVDKETFERLLEGKDPLSGAELVQSGGNDKRVAVVDMPFAAPKSVSHAALVLGDERVVHAHQKAVEAALKYIEENAIQTREYKKNENGELIKDEEGKYVRERVNTNNMLVAKVQHSTARPIPGEAEDPHLHTHALIFNITYNENKDKFKAVEFLEIFKQQSKIDKIYKSELAKNLKELGYAIEAKGNGKFEIAGYTEDVLNNFSKRHMQIEQAKKELKSNVNFENLNEEKLDVIAQHSSKSDKSELITGEELKNEWKAQHEYKGITSLEELQKNIQAAAEKQEEFKYSTKEVLELSAKILTQNESTFTKDELLQQALEIGLGNYSIEDLEEELNKVKKTGQKHGYEIKKLNDKNFTTKEMHGLEKENIKILKHQKTFENLTDKDTAEKLIDNYEQGKGFNLTNEQREAVVGILTSNEQFIAIQGSAGVGKTTLLDALRESLEKEGKEIDIQVLTPTGKAASEAVKASGIQSKTIDSFLLSLEKEAKEENEYIAKNENGFVDVTNKYIDEKIKELEQQKSGVHAHQNDNNSSLSVNKKEEPVKIDINKLKDLRHNSTTPKTTKKETKDNIVQQQQKQNGVHAHQPAQQKQNYNKDDFSLKRTNIRRLDSKYYVKAEDFKNRTPFAFLTRFKDVDFIGNNFTGYRQIDFKKGYKDNAKGVKRTEYRSFKGDTFTYKSVSKFRDGTKIEYEFEEFSPLRFKFLGKHIALSNILGYKTHTNNILTADKERLYSKNAKGSVLGLLNYKQETHKDKYTKQSRYKLSVAAILSLSYNSKTAQTKTGGKYKRRALEFNILGFKITKESLKITDKKGNVLKHITHTRKSFLGKEISNNLIDKTKETGLIKNLTKNLLVKTNYTKDVYKNKQDKILQVKAKDIKHNVIELDKRLKTTKISYRLEENKYVTATVTREEIFNKKTRTVVTSKLIDAHKKEQTKLEFFLNNNKHTNQAPKNYKQQSGVHAHQVEKDLKAAETLTKEAKGLKALAKVTNSKNLQKEAAKKELQALEKKADDIILQEKLKKQNLLKEVEQVKKDKKVIAELNSYAPVKQAKAEKIQDIANNVSKKIDKEQKQTQKILIVDETSLLDARKANKLLKYAKENDIKVVFMGDSKQLKSIGAGNFFEDLKQNTKVLKVDESVRQRNNKVMKEIVDTIAKEKNVSKGLDMLDKLNKVKEFKVEVDAKDFKNIDEYKQAYEAARAESLEKMTTSAAKEIARDVKNTLAVAATREIVNKINEKVKANLGLREDENTFNIKVIKNLSPSAKMVAGNYEPGKDVIIPNKNIKTLEKFKEYEISEIDEINNKIIVKDKDNNEVKIDLKENALDLQIYTKETQKFAKGDKVVFLQNNRDLGVFNGELGYVKEYDKEKHMLKVEKENGDVVEFNPKAYDKFDLGYAITAHKSQGTTSKKVVAVLDTKYKDMNTFNLAYVALSRHKEDVQVFTTNKQELKEQVQKEQQKRSTLEYTQEDFDKEVLIEDLKDFENLTKTQEEKAYEIAKAFANTQEQKQQLQNTSGVHAHHDKEQKTDKIEDKQIKEQQKNAISTR